MVTQRIRYFINHNDRSYEVLFSVTQGVTYIFHKNVELLKVPMIADNRQTAEMLLYAYFHSIENTIAGEKEHGK